MTVISYLIGIALVINLFVYTIGKPIATYLLVQEHTAENPAREYYFQLV